MSRWYYPRIASLAVALAVLTLLAACANKPKVAAPVASRQPPIPGEFLPPPKAPSGQPGAVKVALLLPMSGANAELGKAMLDAAQLALFTTGGDRLTLVPRDTAGTAEGAATAAKAVIADGVGLILGPLLAAEVEAVKPLARDANINVIAFSTATQLAGGNVFLMGFLPRQEAQREVGFARERGVERFAALASNTAYGHLMADSMRDAVKEAGGMVTKVEYFDARGTDTSTAIQRLVQGPASAAAPAAAAPPTTDGFDALLLPEGGPRLKQLAQQLKRAGVDTSRVRLLGSGLWDDPSIAGEPALAGGWFAASPPEGRRDFEGRYQAAYNRAPPRLASLAFDSAALAAVLVKNEGGQPFSQQAIQNPNGFTGVDGLFRFTQAGLVQRGLAVLEVAPQGAVVVSPAPASFANLGF